MTFDYIVVPGDCLTSIARAHGFRWQTLWNLPANSQLRTLRGEPNILFPGDVVAIPNITEKEESRATEIRHKFKQVGDLVRLRLRLMKTPDAKGEEQLEEVDDDQLSVTYNDPVAPKADPDEPWKNAAFELKIGALVKKGKTTDDGYIEEWIAPDAKSAELAIERGTAEERHYTLKLGFIDPVSTVTGASDRLNNLGLWDGSRPDSVTDEFTEALSEFQRAQSLEVTGKLDSPTQALLKKLHGS